MGRAGVPAKNVAFPYVISKENRKDFSGQCSIH